MQLTEVRALDMISVYCNSLCNRSERGNSSTRGQSGVLQCPYTKREHAERRGEQNEQRD